MTSHAPARSVRTDAALSIALCGGDTTAYAELLVRHGDAAVALSQILDTEGNDHLATEAFARAHAELLNECGRGEFFRGTLLAAVRGAHERTEDVTGASAGVGPAQLDAGALAAAFATLPPRWRAVLWHREVEGESPVQIKPLVGLSVPEISMTVVESRIAFLRAYLDQRLHLLGTACQEVSHHLNSYAQGGLPMRESTIVEQHLDRCLRCTGILLELKAAQTQISEAVAVALLGTAGSAYLKAGPRAPATAEHGRRRHKRSGLAPMAVILSAGALPTGIIAAGIVAAGTIATLMWVPGDNETDSATTLAPPPASQSSPDLSASAPSRTTPTPQVDEIPLIEIAASAEPPGSEQSPLTVATPLAPGPRSQDLRSPSPGPTELGTTQAQPTDLTPEPATIDPNPDPPTSTPPPPPAPVTEPEQSDEEMTIDLEFGDPTNLPDLNSRRLNLALIAGPSATADSRPVIVQFSFSGPVDVRSAGAFTCDGTGVMTTVTCEADLAPGQSLATFIDVIDPVGSGQLTVSSNDNPGGSKTYSFDLGPWQGIEQAEDPMTDSPPDS